MTYAHGNFADGSRVWGKASVQRWNFKDLCEGETCAGILDAVRVHLLVKFTVEEEESLAIRHNSEESMAGSRTTRSAQAAHLSNGSESVLVVSKDAADITTKIGCNDILSSRVKNDMVKMACFLAVCNWASLANFRGKLLKWCGADNCAFVAETIKRCYTWSATACE